MQVGWGEQARLSIAFRSFRIILFDPRIDWAFSASFVIFGVFSDLRLFFDFSEILSYFSDFSI